MALGRGLFDSLEKFRPALGAVNDQVALGGDQKELAREDPDVGFSDGGEEDAAFEFFPRDYVDGLVG